MTGSLSTKTLTNQSKQIKALTTGTWGLNLCGKCSVLICPDYQIWSWAHPGHFWGSGQEYKRRPTYSVSEYFQVINHVNKRFDKIYSILLPEQLFLHNEQEARFEFRFLGLWVLPQNVALQGPCTSRVHFTEPPPTPWTKRGTPTGRSALGRIDRGRGIERPLGQGTWDSG